MSTEIKRTVIWVDFVSRQVTGRLTTVSDVISIVSGFIPVLKDEINDLPTDPQGEDNAS